jgi:hypothetical protein
VISLASNDNQICLQSDWLNSKWEVFSTKNASDINFCCALSKTCVDKNVCNKTNLFLCKDTTHHNVYEVNFGAIASNAT